MILGDYNVSLNFSRDTSKYLTDPLKHSRIIINQWIFNGEYVDVYDELHPGKSSYTWSKSSDILRKDGDPNINKTCYMRSRKLNMLTMVEEFRTILQS